MVLRKKFLVLISILTLGFVIMTAPGYAGDVSVSGFADMIYTMTDDGTPTNEEAFTIDGEIDFMAERSNVAVRLDLDINKATSDTHTHTIPGVTTSAPVDASATDPLSIEQIFFSLPAGMLTVTAGKFNTLIGFEGPDAPGLLQTSYGQVGGPLGTAGALGLTGVMLTGKMGMAELDVFVKQTDGDIGAQVRLVPLEGVGLSIGLVQTDGTVKAAGLPTNVGGDIFDVIATWKGDTPAGMLFVAGEFVSDDELSTWGIWANDTIGPYGLTLRYDSLDCDLAGRNCAAAFVTTTSTTVAGSYAVNDNLSTLLEWKTMDSDATGVADVDWVTLEAVVTF